MSNSKEKGIYIKRINNCNSKISKIEITLHNGRENVFQVDVIVNSISKLDEIIENVKHSFPYIKTGIDGMWNGYYISYYFQGKICVVTSIEMGITAAYLHPSYFEENKRLFTQNLIRNHILRHFIGRGYLVYHAAAIVEKDSNLTTIILGKSGSGKTTFTLEAVQSRKYYFVSEDKVLINPSDNSVIGTPTIHLREDRKNKYNELIDNMSLINGGKSEKKYQCNICEKYYKKSGNLHQVIILNQEYDSKKSFLRKVLQEESIKSIIEASQSNIYLNTERRVKEQAYNKIFEFPIFELYRSSEDTNFDVFINSCRKI